MKASTWTKTGQGESHAEGDNNKSEISSSEPKRKHHCKFYAVSIGGMLGVFKDWGQCKKMSMNTLGTAIRDLMIN